MNLAGTFSCSTCSKLSVSSSSGHCCHCNVRRRLFACCVCKIGLIFLASSPPCFTALIWKIRFPFSWPSIRFLQSPIFLFLYFDPLFLLPSGFPMVRALFSPMGLCASRQKGATGPHQGEGGRLVGGCTQDSSVLCSYEHHMTASNRSHAMQVRGVQWSTMLHVLYSCPV